MTNLPPAPIYLPYEAGPYRPTMGLQSLDLEDWIEIDERYRSELDGKTDLLASRHGEAFDSLPEALPAAQEALDLLVDHLPRRFPDLFHRDGDGFACSITGKVWDLKGSGLHPLDLAGRLVQEDLCLMQRNDIGWRLTAASLCAPSRWSLAEKMGRPLADIHAPVPLYAEKLARPVDRFFDKLTTTKPVFRINWSIKDDPTLFQPLRYTAPPGAQVTPETAGAKLYLRTERQTLRRFPVSDAILFTIRTYIHPLQDCVATREEAEQLASALDGLPPDLARYKNISRFAEVLAEWLTRRPAETTGGPNVA